MLWTNLDAADAHHVIQQLAGVDSRSRCGMWNNLLQSIHAADARVIQQLAVCIPWLNGVTLAWIIFATCIFNYCKVIDNPIYCVAKVQATTTSSSFFVSTFAGPHFLDLVLPFKWFNKKVHGMFQCLLALPQLIFSHFQLHPWLLPMFPFTSFLSDCDAPNNSTLFFFGFGLKGGTFSLSCVGCWFEPLCSLRGIVNIVVL